MFLLDKNMTGVFFPLYYGIIIIKNVYINRGDLQMRNIPEEIKKSIVDVFPKENTLAVIVFGSYGTSRQRDKSDIDIAWVPVNKVPITEVVVKTQELIKSLQMEVDLKIVTENYTVALRKSIFEGDVIYQTKDFRDYLSDFYIENSDLIDILNWREMNGIYNVE